MEKVDAGMLIDTQNFMPDAVILANGSYPRHELPVGLLQSAPYLICCDGAINELAQRGLKPNVIIGDGDSISDENRIRFDDIFFQVDDQETNDQTKAVNYLLKSGKKRISILGATGGREDHALGNISLLMEYAKEGAEVRMYTNYGVFIPMSGKTTFTTKPGQQISIFNFDATELSSEGLQYPIRDFTSWWQGTLNEASDSEVTIHASGSYLVYLEYYQ